MQNIPGVGGGSPFPNPPLHIFSGLNVNVYFLHLNLWININPQISFHFISFHLLISATFSNLQFQQKIQLHNTNETSNIKEKENQYTL